MKVCLNKDERYPDYGMSVVHFSDDEDEIYEVPEELWERYQTVSKMYEDVQDELAKVYYAK
jgi:hypothetical protein